MNIKATCECKNITVEATLTQPTASYTPRACDCDFCVEHGASYVSDPQGVLSFNVADKSLLDKQRQGSNTAEFLICKKCDTLVGVIYSSEGKTFGTVNSAIIDEDFKEPVTVSPKTLSKDQKTERWQSVWFQKVSLS